MPASDFVTSHITEHYQDYHKYCRSLYKKRSNMADELLHEFLEYMLTVMPKERAEKYEADGKLKAIGKLIIKRMWLRRGRKAQGKQANPMNEICNLWDVDSLVSEIEDGSKETKDDNKLSLLLEAIRIKLSSDDWFNTSVFLMNHGYTLAVDKNTGDRRLERTKEGPKSLAAIAKEARLNRDQLGKSCKQAAFEIKRYVEQGGSI